MHGHMSVYVCVNVSSSCVCVRTIHLKPAFISFSIKYIVVFMCSVHINPIIVWAFKNFDSLSSLFVVVVVVALTKLRDLFYSLCCASFCLFLFEHTIHKKTVLFIVVSCDACMLHHHGALISFSSFYTCVNGRAVWW